MAVRRVYVIWINPLFHESARLLLKHPEIIWVGATADLGVAREEIQRLQPDTILFEKAGAVVPPGVVEFLEEERREVRLIGFSLDDNQMSLYHREHQAVTEVGDLLQFILG